jgi:ketosteroid isomerase-like protein
MTRHRWLPAVVALIAAACARTETPEQARDRMRAETEAARAAIDQDLEAFVRHFNAGQADSLAMHFAENARILPPNEPAVHGRDSIRAWIANMFAAGSWTLTARNEEVIANGPLGVQRGTFTLSFTPGPNTPPGMTAMTDTGKFITHVHKVDDRWLIVDDIWNSDRPLPPPPPARGGRR